MKGFTQESTGLKYIDIKLVYRNLNAIPENAAISAQTMLCPHLAFREKIYHYPYVGDAEYIALLLNDPNKYTITEEEYSNKIQELKNSHEWIVALENEALLIFKRVKKKLCYPIVFFALTINQGFCKSSLL